MKWAEISIKLTHEATEAVANIFHDLGAAGVVIEDPKVITTYKNSKMWDYCDIPDPEDMETVVIKAYLPMDKDLDRKLEDMKSMLKNLDEYFNAYRQGDFILTEVQEEDWATAWKDYFHPIKVSEHIVIKPSWEEYIAQENEIIIELDPGMAFGTGTHHTTVLCLRLLDEMVKKGQTIFDVGTGSGILAVAAAKLGAEKVRAIDLDTVAVGVAKENATINHVDDIVQVAHGDLLTGISGQADIIVANIIADVIINLVQDIRPRLKFTGHFIASGIISDRVSDVTAAMIENGFSIDKIVEEGGWAAIVAHKGAR